MWFSQQVLSTRSLPNSIYSHFLPQPKTNLTLFKVQLLPYWYPECISYFFPFSLTLSYLKRSPSTQNFPKVHSNNIASLIYQRSILSHLWTLNAISYVIFKTRVPVSLRNIFWYYLRIHLVFLNLFLHLQSKTWTRSQDFHF